MSGKVLGLSVVVVGVALWIVMAWQTSGDEPPAPPAPGELPPPPTPKPPSPAAAIDPEPAPAEAPEVAEPVAQEPAAPEEPETNPRKLDELIKGDQGPVAEYRALFQSEPRESKAAEIEKQIRAAFPDSDGAPEMVRSILCRKTICKLELRWSMEHMRPYIAGLTRAKANFQYPLAVSPVGTKDADGTRLVEVYLKRRPPSAAGAIEVRH